MFNYIKGILIEKNNENIVVEAQGIAYDIFIPQNSIFLLPEEKEEVLIYTYLAIREDAISLFGFITKDDKKMFLKLISVNGVGPKNALNIISSLGLQKIMIAIAKDDKKLLSSIKGIGEKTASRIIIDLKDKLDFNQITNKKDLEVNLQNDSIKLSIKMENVIQALISLGYQNKKAKQALLDAKVDDTMSEDMMLKKALHFI
ncbi:MAG: Holliday junction branch migration protein RuvA [Eubacteriales bacterium]|nr:Holliday junction branch migration protein RuvA [Eubacteriales bacterium]